MVPVDHSMVTLVRPKYNTFACHPFPMSVFGCCSFSCGFQFSKENGSSLIPTFQHRRNDGWAWWESSSPNDFPNNGNESQKGKSRPRYPRGWVTAIRIAAGIDASAVNTLVIREHNILLRRDEKAVTKVFSFRSFEHHWKYSNPSNTTKISVGHNTTYYYISPEQFQSIIQLTRHWLYMSLDEQNLCVPTFPPKTPVVLTQYFAS